VLSFVTAGESHGKALVAVLEGIPAGVLVATNDIRYALARRRLGFGRGARMDFEADEVTLLAGVWRGKTLGSPIAIEVANTEWPKWEETMNPDSVEGRPIPDTARSEPLTRPRPGHADLPGMLKYGFSDARPILERASARETAARVAIGTVAAAFLRQAAGIEILSHVVQIGKVKAQPWEFPNPSDLQAIDQDPVRCFSPVVSASMQEAIVEAKNAGETLGGVIEVLAYGVPVGLGSHTSGKRRLDAQLAGALMGIQAIKGVEIGDGFALAALPGSRAHDEIAMTHSGVTRLSNHAGGIEGGIANGEVIRLRAAMKPIATVPNALKTVDVISKIPTQAHHQRSDITAVPAVGVVAEAEVALVLAEAFLEKFGGDSLTQTQGSFTSFLKEISARGL
jgi:chorismate synthase